MRSLGYYLRYRTLHQLYWSKGQHTRYGVRKGLNLNPMCSSSDDAVWKRDEPRWLYRLRTRLFSNRGEHLCPERGNVPWPIKMAGKTDRWQQGPDGHRTCSFCGSIDFDGLLDIAERATTDKRYRIEGTTKTYKLYVRQPGVRNASEGAIKFYGHHRPASLTPQEIDILNRGYIASVQNADAETAEWSEKMKARAGAV